MPILLVLSGHHGRDSAERKETEKTQYGRFITSCAFALLLATPAMAAPSMPAPSSHATTTSAEGSHIDKEMVLMFTARRSQCVAPTPGIARFTR